MEAIGPVIVVDVGCHPQGNEVSVEPLVRGFRPEILFGFDPYPDLVEGVERVEETLVVRRRLAAWTHDGFVPLVVDGITTGVDERQRAGGVEMPCFDLATWLRALPSGDLVLKLDAEGAEYPVLSRIRELDVDLRLSVVIVEWHPPATAHGFYGERPDLRCRVEEWPS